MLLKNQTASAIIYVLIFGTVAAYFFAVGRLAVNFPFWDDYNAVLEPILKMEASENSGEKLAIAVAQHNEHRIAFGKIIQFLLFKTQGEVNFRTLIWIGNLGLLCLTAAIIIGARKTIPCPELWMVAPILVISPIQGYQMIWAMASLSNFWVLAFAAWSLYLLTRSGGIAFTGASMLAVLATFTSGQGIVCFIAGIVVLLLQRQWWKTGIWIFVMFLTALLYFKGYSRPAHHPPLEISLRSAVFFPTMIGSAPANSVCALAGLAGIKGASLFKAVRACMGLGMLGIALYLWRNKYYRRNLFLAVLLLYLVGLCGAAALSRSGFGLDQAVDSHYHIISILISVLLILAMLDIHAQGSCRPVFKKWVPIATSCLLILFWFQFLPEVRELSAHIARSKERFAKHQDPDAVIWATALHEEGLDILWRSYFVGLLPSKTFDHLNETELSESRLRRIAVINVMKDGKTMPQGNLRVVAGLTQQGTSLSLRPATNLSELSDSEGWVGVLRGKLFYHLPPF